ncbi:hypothetical protein AMATHDRAFT_2290 [Amanita thiersii Skay4041]|uniref:Histone deacetylase interacting domain-containing protein n=1 Tax=Amanita thiersii Skay4041 TaxID=703135 RepID=A0A2A9NWR4_9AGAR|nr:hypothetical protein AMATHDRAFT_2290 [Amanita thiersii Skay4041]
MSFAGTREYVNYKSLEHDQIDKEINGTKVLDTVQSTTQLVAQKVEHTNTIQPSAIYIDTERSHDDERPSLQDALKYVTLVKTTFHEDPAVYQRFLNLLKSHRENRLDKEFVIDKIHDLFYDKPTLIDGFNDFLPREEREGAKAKL